MKIKLLESEDIVDAVLDKEKQTACYLNIETDDFDTITSDQFELIPDDDEDTAEEIESEDPQDEVEDDEDADEDDLFPNEEPTESNTPEITQEIIKLARGLGENVKSITIEFK